MRVADDPLFAGVDRALFAAAFGERLRSGGLGAPLDATHRFTAALAAAKPLSIDDVYWMARLSYVTSHIELGNFERVFAAVFESAAVDADRSARQDRTPAVRAGDHLQPVRGRPDTADGEGVGLPWASLPSIVGSAEDASDAPWIPERLASRDPALSAKPFDLLDDDEMRAVSAALEASFTRWPHRRSRRARLGPSGNRIAFRATLRRARRTGGEVFDLVRLRRRTRPRPVVALVDVSGSMEPFARGYLHVMRALAVAGRAEVFVFATQLTRVTPALRHHSAAEAVERTTDAVGDRFGGTRLATSLAALLRNPAWSAHLRGGVVLIVSDGADTDDPDELRRRLRRLARLTHRVVWVNPRLAAPAYQPLVAGMAAALPHCDAVLPGNSLGAIDDVLLAITE